MIKLKEKVLYCLKHDEQCRNSDIRLMQLVWWHYHRKKLTKDKDGDVCIKIRDLFELPREDNIKRVRALIQNEQHLYLPTDPEVRKQRKINEEIWRRYCSPSNPARG